MIGVKQTKATNCVAACVASILELPLEAVPDFDPYSWGEELAAWAEQFGFGLANMRYLADYPPPDGEPRGYSLGGLRPNGPGAIGHCVVCKDGWIVFDPMVGEVTEKKRPDEYTFLYPLNPVGAIIT